MLIAQEHKKYKNKRPRLQNQLHAYIAFTFNIDRQVKRQ